MSKKYCTFTFYIRQNYPILEFCSLFMDVPDIHRFPTVHVVKYVLLEPSFGTQEKIQCRSALPIVKL